MRVGNVKKKKKKPKTMHFWFMEFRVFGVFFGGGWLCLVGWFLVLLLWVFLLLPLLMLWDKDPCNTWKHVKEQLFHG